TLVDVQYLYYLALWAGETSPNLLKILKEWKRLLFSEEDVNWKARYRRLLTTRLSQKEAARCETIATEFRGAIDQRLICSLPQPGWIRVIIRIQMMTDRQ